MLTSISSRAGVDEMRVWSIVVYVVGIVLLLVLVGCGVYAVARWRAWNRYMDLVQFTIDKTGSAEAMRHVADVAEAMKDWDAAPAIARIIGGMASAPTRAVARKIPSRSRRPNVADTVALAESEDS
jgi:hypothetical protein